MKSLPDNILQQLIDDYPKFIKSVETGLRKMQATQRLIEIYCEERNIPLPEIPQLSKSVVFYLKILKQWNAKKA